MKLKDLDMFIPDIYEKFFFNHNKGKQNIEKQVNFIDHFIKQEDIGKKVLDLGCGTGKHLRELSYLGYFGKGIDLREDMLRHARMKSKKLPIEFEIFDMTKYRSKEKYDIVTILFTALNYLHSERDILKTIKNSFYNLKDNGILIIESREMKNQPKNTKIKKLRNKIIEIGRWEKDSINNKKTIYKVLLSKEGEDGFMYYDEHVFTGMNTTFLFDCLKKAGFGKIYLYNDYDTERTKNINNINFWKTVLVGYKGGKK